MSNDNTAPSAIPGVPPLPTEYILPQNQPTESVSGINDRDPQYFIDTITEFRERLNDPNNNETDTTMLLRAIEQNQWFLDQIPSLTWRETISKYALRWRGTTERLFGKPPLNVSNLFSKIPTPSQILSLIPFSSIASFKPQNILKLNIPRNPLQLELSTRRKFFTVSKFSEDLVRLATDEKGNINKKIFFLTDPIFEKQQDNEAFVPSNIVTEREIELDIYDHSEGSVTLNAKKLRRDNDKLYLPYGLVYPDAVTDSEMYSILPSKVEIDLGKGQILKFDRIHVVSNGLIYVDFPEDSKFSEVIIKYGKASNIHRQDLKLKEDQKSETGLRNLNNLTKQETRFKKYLEHNKEKGANVNLSQIQSLNRLFDYLKHNYLRYSELDTLKREKDIGTLRQALKHKRTSCQTASYIAYSFIHTNKFSQFITRAGILNGYVLDIPPLNERDEPFEVKGKHYHSITLADFGDLKRVYDISPTTQYKSEKIERKISDLTFNTNAVYRKIKEMFVRGNKPEYEKYKNKYIENLSIVRKIKTTDFKNNPNNIVENLINQTLIKYIESELQSKFNINKDIEFQLHESLGFPFRLIDHDHKRHINYDLLGYISTKHHAKNTASNIKFLEDIGLKNIKGIKKLSRKLPIGEDNLEILRSIKKLKETNPNLMDILIEFHEDVTLKLQQVEQIKRANTEVNSFLEEFLRSNNIDVHTDTFHQIAWLNFVSGDDHYEENFQNELNKFDQPEDLVNFLGSRVNQYQKRFAEYLQRNKNTVIELFKENTHDIVNLPDITISSTFLFQMLLKNENNQKYNMNNKRFKYYVDIRNKLEEDFKRYREELKASGETVDF